MNRQKLRNILSAIGLVLLVILICFKYFNSATPAPDGEAFDQTAAVTAAPVQPTATPAPDIADSAQAGENTGIQSDNDTPAGISSDTQSDADTPAHTEYRFRNNKLLEQHYEKHGIEMGFASKEAYEQAASDVINNPAALFKHEAEDGDEVYYVEETNEFVILSTDGYIRTYFLPNAGKAYFDRQ